MGAARGDRRGGAPAPRAGPPPAVALRPSARRPPALRSCASRPLTLASGGELARAIDQAGKDIRSGAGVHRLTGLLDAVAEVHGRSADEDRRAGVQQGNIALGALFAVEDRPGDAGILVRVS